MGELFAPNSKKDPAFGGVTVLLSRRDDEVTVADGARERAVV